MKILNKYVLKNFLTVPNVIAACCAAILVPFFVFLKPSSPAECNIIPDPIKILKKIKESYK